MSQPRWKLVGKLGAADPIAYGGGFVYEDETGVYAPEITYFQPGSDEDWERSRGAAKLYRYRFILEREPERQWWYSKLGEVAESAGVALSEYMEVIAAWNVARRLTGAAGDIKAYARLYADLIGYFGLGEFSDYPDEMTEDEAYKRYAEEMKANV